MADNVLEPQTFSFGDAKSASTGCSSRVWVSPTSILQRKEADVYTSALLADAMKSLNVLPRFENHFAIKTVHFQVSLDAGGYFLLRKFSS